MAKQQFQFTAPAKDAVSYDPLDCLLLWLVVLEGDQVEEVLSPLKVDGDEVERLRRDNPELVQRMRKLKVAGRLLLRGRLAMLLRARLGEELMNCKDARGLAQLTTAMSRMALWMFWMPYDSSRQKPTDADRLNAVVPASASEMPKLRMGH